VLEAKGPFCVEHLFNVMVYYDDDDDDKQMTNVV